MRGVMRASRGRDQQHRHGGGADVQAAESAGHCLFLYISRPIGEKARARQVSSALAAQTFSSRCSRSQELMTCRNTSYSASLTMVNAAMKASPEQLHQRLARPQLAQRLIQRARQPKGQVVGAADDRIGRLQPLDHAEVAAGERCGDGDVGIGVGAAARGSPRAAPAHPTSARAGPRCGCHSPSGH